MAKKRSKKLQKKRSRPPRRQSNAELAVDEARFRFFAETGSDWFWETDAEDRYTWFGGAIERQVGRPATHYIGRTRTDVAAAGGIDVTGEYWKSHMATIARREAFRDLHQRRVTPRGEMWLSISGAPRFDAEGRYLGYRAAVSDITARKQAEEALLQSEARFRSLADLSSDWYWEQDAELRFVSTTGRESGRGGITAADHTGRRRWELPGTEIVNQSWAEHQATLAARAPFRDVLLRRTAADGAVHYIGISGEPMFDAQGVFSGYRGIARDVTGRVVAERQARAANERLRAAVEDLNEGFCLTDAEDRIVFANRRFREANPGLEAFLAPGRTYEEHEREGLARGYYPEAIGREEQWLAQALALRRAASGPIERQRQDGMWLLVSQQSLPGGDHVTFGLEITEKKRAEDLLKNLNTELERRVAERTVALETAYRELESFSYSVSHDLRSPLGVIASFAGILAKQEAGHISEDGMRLVSVIDGNAQRMGHLIDALLELMRTSRRALVFRQLDIAGIAGTTCRELQRDYPRARIEIGELPAARGDETLIQQVYANLVGNALKFSSKAPSQNVQLGAESRDGAPVYFVRDNGAGFDTAHAAKLFKPFERLHTEDEFPGTGIGLALVQLIVQRHGGRIWAESAPGRGSTFRFTLAGGHPG